jgi:hypothetical protein
LGFCELVKISKLRTTFKVNDCYVMLDEVKDLGQFIEIEGPNEESINAVYELIGKPGVTVLYGYAQLMLAKIDDDKGVTLVFSDEEKDRVKRIGGKAKGGNAIESHDVGFLISLLNREHLLRYRNPDPRCTYPFEPSGVGYCCSYALYVDGDKKIMSMDSACSNCDCWEPNITDKRISIPKTEV